MCACLFLQSSSNLSRIFETATRISFSTFIGVRYLVLITAVAEKPASHKYDVAKGIIIRSVFSVNAGYSPFNEIQNFVGFPELNFLFMELSQVGSM